MGLEVLDGLLVLELGDLLLPLEILDAVLKILYIFLERGVLRHLKWRRIYT